MCARTLQSPQRAKEVKIRQGIRLGLFVVVFGAFIVGGVLFLRSDKLNIAKLDVVGLHSVGNELLTKAVESYFNTTAGFLAHERSWVAFSSAGLADYLESAIPVIESAQVERNGLGAITLLLKERQPYAQMCSVSGNALVVPCFHIDAQGIIFGEIEPTDTQTNSELAKDGITIEPAHIKVGFSDFAPTLMGNGKPQQFNQHIWEGITNTIAAFDSHGLIIDSLLVVSSTTARIDVGSFIIKAPLFGEFSQTKAAENVALLLAQKFNWHKGMTLPQLDYIDARYGNALFYRTLGGSQQEDSPSDE